MAWSFHGRVIAIGLFMDMQAMGQLTAMGRVKARHYRCLFTTIRLFRHMP
jgi:hypothetical protein